MKKLLVAVCLVALCQGALGANDQRARVLMQAAEAKAKVEGDLASAIKLYRDAEKEAGSNRALVAQALLKMAEAHQALGDGEAQKIYQRLVRDFADQAAIAELAATRLVPATNAAGAATLRNIEGFNASGNVTADGRLATYVNWATGNIAVHDLQKGTSRELTRREDYDVYDPVISRDGRFVAYQSFNACIERRPLVPSNGVLCVLPIEGEPRASAITVLERADVRGVIPMDWSPDGASIAAVIQREDGTAQVAIIGVADRRLTVLQSTDWRGSTRVFFSPDGRHLAFDVPVNDTSDQREIRVVAVDGSDGATAVPGSSQNIVMGWTPDGSHLLFASDRTGAMGLWARRVVKARPDGAPRLVHAGLGGALSLGVTRSASLYFGVESGGRDIEVVSLDATGGGQVAPPARPIATYPGRNFMPEWSRDGKLLAYVSQRGVSTNVPGRVIGIRDSATGTLRELRPKLTYINGLNWSPDDTKLVTSGRDLRGRVGVFVIDAHTGEATFVTEGAYPAYSPDGSRLFFVRPVQGLGPRTIVERDLTSNRERTIVTGEFARFAVSPDGRLLAAAWGGVGTGSAHAIVVIRADTGEVRELLRSDGDDDLGPYVGVRWAPDGSALLVRRRIRRFGGELWLVPTTGDTPRKLDADVKGWATGPNGVFSVHPDGRQVAGTRLSPDSGPEVRVLENFLSALK